MPHDFCAHSLAGPSRYGNHYVLGGKYPGELDDCSQLRSDAERPSLAADPRSFLDLRNVAHANMRRPLVAVADRHNMSLHCHTDAEIEGIDVDSGMPFFPVMENT